MQAAGARGDAPHRGVRPDQGGAEILPRAWMISSHYCVAAHLRAGGPGHEGPRPTEASAWIKAALNHFRVLLLDQRGTGRSAAITAATLARRGTPQQQADYLTHFRQVSLTRKWYAFPSDYWKTPYAFPSTGNVSCGHGIAWWSKHYVQLQVTLTAAVGAQSAGRTALCGMRRSCGRRWCRGKPSAGGGQSWGSPSAASAPSPTCPSRHRVGLCTA
jgi:hypothetical protein